MRIDQAEREIYARMLEVSHAVLSGFVAGAGDGDDGPSVEVDGETVHPSEEPHRRIYRSIFGEVEVDRYVCAAGPKKKIPYSPVDARLGMHRGEYSYVLEDWLERLYAATRVSELLLNDRAANCPPRYCEHLSLCSR
ncbi:MAG: hypothetical protein KDB27_02130 [Planctomycetales bacterium]|nr:hypothetical protein [Planctomycetales bacterium]